MYLQHPWLEIHFLHFSGTYFTLCQQSCWCPSSNERYKYRKSKLISIIISKLNSPLWKNTWKNLDIVPNIFKLHIHFTSDVIQKIHEESNLFYDNTAVRWWFLQYHKVMCVWNKLAIIIIITTHNHNIVLYTISHFKDHDHPQGYQKNDSVEKDIVYCHYQGVKISYFCFWMVWMILLQKVKLSFAILNELKLKLFRIYSK